MTDWVQDSYGYIYIKKESGYNKVFISVKNLKNGLEESCAVKKRKWIQWDDRYYYEVKSSHSPSKRTIIGKDKVLHCVKKQAWKLDNNGNLVKAKIIIGKPVKGHKKKPRIIDNDISVIQRKITLGEKKKRKNKSNTKIGKRIKTRKLLSVKLRRKKRFSKNKQVLMVEIEKKREDDDLSIEIKNLLVQYSDDRESNLSHSGGNQEFFLNIIRKIFLILRNETNLLKYFSINQLKRIPTKIYEIAKNISSFQGFIREEKNFLKYIHSLYGFIYLATNMATQNKKIYVGQTKKTIEREWGDILSSGNRLKKRRDENPNKKIIARYIENTIAKYGRDVWQLSLIDIAYSKSELNEKERYYIMDVYDSMNPDKGYNLTSGGEEGMEFSKEVLERLSTITKNWFSDPENRKGHREIMEDIYSNPEYKKKMSEIMKEICSRPEIKEQRSKTRKKLYDENPEYKEKINEARRRNWADPEFQEKQRKSHTKEIYDLSGFLIDIIYKSKKEMVIKYKVSRETITEKIKKILKPFGIKGFLEAKRFLKNRDLDEIINQIDPKWYEGF